MIIPGFRPPGLVISPPVGPAWLPTDETSLAIWLDASDAATIPNSAGAATGINDKSGNGNDFNTGVSRPVTGSRVVNALNVLDFDGIDDFIENTPYSIPANIQFVFVAEVDTVADSGRTLLRAGGATRFNLDAGQTANFNAFVRAFGTGNVGGGINGDLKGAPHIIRLVMDLVANEWRKYQDGTLVETGAAGYQTAMNQERLVMMASHPTASFLDGAFCESQIFAGTDNVVGQKSEGFLAYKWGLEANLPAGHPYKAGAP